MKDLSSVLAKIKLDNGYLEFESSDTEVQVDPYKNDEIIGFVNRVITIADKIIEFFMVECNVVRAKDFNIRSIPIFYRIHDKPDALKLESTFDLIKDIYRFVR